MLYNASCGVTPWRPPVLDAAADIAQTKDRMAYEEARTAPPPDFPALPDIPGGRYTDPEFLALERERMWKRAWLYAGHLDQLPKTGSWFLTRNSGAPVVVVRTLEDE